VRREREWKNGRKKERENEREREREKGVENIQIFWRLHQNFDILGKKRQKGWQAQTQTAMLWLLLSMKRQTF